MFIGVAVRHVEPLTYVWLRLTIAAGAHVAVSETQGRAGSACRAKFGDRSCCWRCSTMPCRSRCSAGARPISPAGSPRSSTRRRRSGACSSPISSRQDERMTPRKIAGVLLGFAGVATMIGPTLLADSAPMRSPSWPASPPRCAMLSPASGRGGSGAWGSAADVGDHRPADGRRADDAAAGAAGRPALDPAAAAAHGLGRDRRAGAALHRFRLRPLFPADRFGRRDQCAAGHPAGAAVRHPVRQRCSSTRCSPRRISSGWR